MTTDFVISIKPAYWELMEEGIKTIEVRRQAMNLLAPDSKVWLYSTLPIAGIVGYAVVKELSYLPVADAWADNFQEIAIAKRDYDNYLSGVAKATLISWGSAYKLHTCLPLKLAQSKIPSFTPPQFYAAFAPPRFLRRRSCHKVF